MASRRLLPVLLVALLLSAGCSLFSATATVHRNDELSWGSRPDQRVEFELRDEPGLVDGVAFAWVDVEGDGRASVGRRGGEDVWISSVTPVADAPTVVFGGVIGDVSSVRAVAAGEVVELELMPVDGDAYSVVLGTLPPRWAEQGVFSVDVLATLENGDEARFELQSVG